MPVSVVSRRPVVRSVVRSVVNRRVVVRGVVTVVACVTAAASTAFVPRSARADAGSSLVAAANGARAASGLASLSVSGDLAAAASRQAARMAQSGVLAHTPNLSSVVCCWTTLGENVGEGPSASAVQSAFMASPMHRANILSGSYTQIGVGVAVDAKGTLWVSEIFRRPSGAVAQAAPAPQPAPAPVVHAPARATTPVHQAAPQVRPLGDAAPQAASRDLPGGRPPLDAGHLLAGWLAAHRVTGTDPVSKLLDFAAGAATVQH